MNPFNVYLNFKNSFDFMIIFIGTQNVYSVTLSRFKTTSCEVIVEIAKMSGLNSDMYQLQNTCFCPNVMTRTQ